ncbi:hypothetical protein E4H12_12300 [Candidatus Thorarchaeota archaeon]|nr:MAG: hypothetical protein E4H12_12300 [Candidatus Thorarchaeota archaeon]
MTPLFTLIITSIVAVSGPNYIQDVRRVAGLSETQCVQQKQAEYKKAVESDKNVIVTCRRDK